MSDPPEICAFEVSVCAHGHIHVWMRDEADCIVGIAGLGAVDADTLAAAQGGRRQSTPKGRCVSDNGGHGVSIEKTT
jgi:hypothetical protein